MRMQRGSAQAPGWKTGTGSRERGVQSRNFNPPTRPSRVHLRAGQDLVEFAIIIPLLFIFIFGVIDFARLFHALVVVHNAAREGARYGSLYGLDQVVVQNGSDYYEIQTADVQAVVRNEASNLGLNMNEAGVAISVTCPTHTPNNHCSSGERLRVVLSYPFQLVTGLVFNDPTLTLTRSAEMVVP